MSRWLRYNGYYSNACGGKKKRQNIDGADFIIADDPDDQYIKGCNKPRARLMQKIYEVDPLICPECGGKMRIIAFIEDYKIVKKILNWLSINEFKRDRPPPKRLAPADSFDDYRCDDYNRY